MLSCDRLATTADDAKDRPNYRAAPFFIIYRRSASCPCQGKPTKSADRQLRGKRKASASNSTATEQARHSAVHPAAKLLPVKHGIIAGNLCWTTQSFQPRRFWRFSPQRTNTTIMALVIMLMARNGAAKYIGPMLSDPSCVLNGRFSRRSYRHQHQDRSG